MSASPAQPPDVGTVILEVRWSGERGEAAAAELRRMAAAAAEHHGVALLVDVRERDQLPR